MGARSLAWDCVQLGECRPAHRSRKDRARWCRGRTGVPHAWTWRDDRTLPNIGHGPSLHGAWDGWGYAIEIEVYSTCTTGVEPV